MTPVTHIVPPVTPSLHAGTSIRGRARKLTKRADIGKDINVLPSVWSMRLKRDITTNEIKKYKARLNLHGRKQEFGANYYETDAPVVTWFSIRLLIVIGIIFG